MLCCFFSDEVNRLYGKNAKIRVGLRVGWIDFGRFGGPIDFSLLRFFLSPAWNDEKEMKNKLLI